MQSYQRHVPSDKVRSSGNLLKMSVIEITKNIILGAKTAIASPDINDLHAWGAEIESFDAFIGIYYEDDKAYQEAKEKAISDLKELNPYDKDMINKKKIKKVYDVWFSLICKKLAKFKIFPPLPVSFAQGKGELRETE